MPTTLTRRAARLLAATTVLALATACPEPPPADTAPPAAAALTVGTTTESSIQLRWTAVGDDGSTGTAASYELRFLGGAACPINQSNFSTATQVNGLGAPQEAGTAEAFTVPGFSGDATFCFMLKVSDEAGNASFSGAAVASTADVVAPAKAALAASNVGDTSATLSWTSVGDNDATGTATGYELRYASGASCPLTSSSFGSGTAVSGVPAPASAGTSQSVAVSGLTASTDYCFALKVTDEVGNSSLSSSLPVTTGDTVSPAAAVLQVGATTGTSITLGWAAVGDDGSTGTATSYELRYAGAASCPLTQATFSSSGTAVSGLPAPGAAGSSESFTVSGLTPDTAYCFMLKVTDDAGNSSFSGSRAGATRDVVAPSATVISAGTVTGTSVQLSWTAVGDDGSTGTATSYDLRYGSGAACPLTQANFSSGTAAAGLPAPGAAGSSESFTVTGLTSDTSYCFMLAVSDDGGNASYSNSLSRQTPDVTPPASATLSAGVVAGTTVRILWTAVGDDGSTGTATSYDLRYRSGASCPITSANFATSTTVSGLQAPSASGAPETFIVQGLTSDTPYCFMLQVVDEALNSSLSNALDQATPDVTAPSAVTLAASVFDTELRFNWIAVGDDGSTGTASSQELRYLTGAACPIDTANFGNGTLVAGLGAPSAPGTPEMFIASGLQRQTSYCFALKVFDNAGNASVSNSFAGTTPDTSAPDTPALALGTVTSRSVAVTFTAVGDDGSTGTASSYDFRYLSGAACPITAANFAGATQATTAPPQPAGSQETVVVGSLTPGASYCFALRVTDDASNTSGLSSSVAATTPVDNTAPGPVADLTTANPAFSSIDLTWTAVADDGNVVATGPASSYELRYLTGAACPISPATFGTGTPVTGLPAPGAPGAPESVTVTGLADGVSHCFLLKVLDASNNSSFSNVANGTTSPDTSPPAAVADLAALGPDSMGNVGLTWTAVGAHGNTGTATDYDLRYQLGDCSAFDFSTAIPVVGLPAPAPAGTPETFSFGGLSIFEKYCFGLQVSNNAPTSSLSNPALAFAGPSAQIAAIRALMHGAPSSPVALNATVHGAIVTFIKSGFGGFPAGAVDGPGFFIQNGGTGPALFFAMDPAVVLPGLAVSDVLDVSITEGRWLSCGGTCTADNSMYVITQATATPTSTGSALPAAQDLSAVTLPLPIGAGPWEYEHERVTATGTIGPVTFAGTGFSRVQLTTAGTTSPDQQLRFTDQVAVSKGLASGCQVTVNSTPMWRFGGSAQFAAWAAADVTPASCPAIAVSSTVPAEASRNALADTTYALTINQPMTPATISVQAASGPCVAANTLQLSADQTFTSCVGATVALSGLSNVLTITPAAPLTAGARYRARLLGPAGSGNGNVVTAPLVTPNGFVTAPATGCTPRAVVISQIYGGGGNAGSLYRNDFIELHNRGTTAVDLTGWTVQYTSAAGTSWTAANITNLSGTIAPGGYFLIQEAAQGGGTVNLPPPDVAGTIAMGATAGKVALVSSTTPLTGGCPSGATVVDLVGYGATATCFAGAPTLGLTNTTSAQREEIACADTGNHYADFAVFLTAPRNSATAANTCSCP